MCVCVCKRESGCMDVFVCECECVSVHVRVLTKKQIDRELRQLFHFSQEISFLGSTLSWFIFFQLKLFLAVTSVNILKS